MTPAGSMPDLYSILDARGRIDPYLTGGRVRRSEALSSAVGAEVFLKTETDQPTGSFKIRGACNAILKMLGEEGVRGVTTASTGNHARAVAYLAGRHHLDVAVYVPSSVSEDRVRALRDTGARVVRSCPDQTTSIRAAEEFAVTHGYRFIPPFDHPDVISGQGTIGVELCENPGRLDAVVVPVSGGGLVAGIGVAVTALSPRTKVIAVCAERAPAMKAALNAGRPVPVPEIHTVAESLMGDLGPDNRYTFRIVQSVIDEIATVDDRDIVAAMTRLREDDGLDVEGAAAASTAYLRTHASRWRGARVALLVTGTARPPQVE